ncbi:MAG TPA: hypothetical protein VIT44_17770 [Cyclobacteriaceae bacterium]
MRIIFSFLFLVIFHHAYSQDNTGFYIQIDKKTNCPQEVRTFDNVGVFCVPNKPILDRTVFTSISEIQIDHNKKRKYIDLYLSAKGMELLKTVVTSLPNSTLILVVDNKVVGVLKNKDVVGRFIRVDSDMVSQQIEWIHEKLKPAP